MKILTFSLYTLLLMSVSTIAMAYDLNYSVLLKTTYVEDVSAFSGTDIGDIFSGSFSVDSGQLGVEAFDSGDAMIANPSKLEFNFIIGAHSYSYAFDSGRDYISDPDFGFADSAFTVNNSAVSNSIVTDILSFTLDQAGDADSYELFIDTQDGTWSAYDAMSDFSINGTVSISAVPLPAAFWLFISGIMGLVKRGRYLKDDRVA